MTMWMLFDAVLFGAGYAASIYSWPAIKLRINGAETEIADLQARASALKAAALKVVP
jgi:hypothetical protein